MSAVEPGGSPKVIEAGTRVDIRNRFQHTWSRGFEVIEVLGDGRSYKVARLSDGSPLPGEFDATDVRPERRRQGLWWY